MNLNQLFRKLTKKNFTFHKVILGGAAKISTIFLQDNATYHPMSPDTDVTYQTRNLFSSDNCFI